MAPRLTRAAAAAGARAAGGKSSNGGKVGGALVGPRAVEELAGVDATPNLPTAHLRKDLGLVMDGARRNGSRVPVTALVDQFYGDVQKMGGQRWDTSSLIKRLK